MRVAAARLVVGLALLVGGAAAFAQAQPPADQIIVKWRDGSSATAAAPARACRSSALVGDAPAAQAAARRRHGSAAARSRARQVRMSAVLERMAADPNVEYAVADEHRWVHAVPSDPLFADQWYFQSTEISATHAQQAWDITVGGNTTVVAVLDTGVRFEHPDLLRLRRRQAARRLRFRSARRRTRTTATAATPMPPIPATS